MNRGIFVKIMFGFNESRAKVSHELKAHVKGVTSTSLMLRLSVYVNVVYDMDIFKLQNKR